MVVKAMPAQIAVTTRRADTIVCVARLHLVRSCLGVASTRDMQRHLRTKIRKLATPGARVTHTFTAPPYHQAFVGSMRSLDRLPTCDSGCTLTSMVVGVVVGVLVLPTT